MATEEPRRSIKKGASFIDDTEDPLWTVAPSDNVYSYFMFISPTEIAKEGGSFTWDSLMAYLLVLLNFFMQGWLLYTVFNEVVMGNIEWQNGIMNNPNQVFAPKPEGCNDGGSLCFMENNTFTCAPPSVQLTGRWDELDTNGDGIWTLEEVTEAQEALQCKYVVNPVEVFNVFITFLKAREKILWLHPDVKAGKAIHLPYFTYAAGDIIMCGYRNQFMCPNLLKRGVFHAPLKYYTAPRVGKTIESALEYCNNLLEPGGMCEKTLPSTYTVWKISSAAQCKTPRFEKMVYEHPKTGVKKSMVSVDYDARQAYDLSKTQQFQVYKGIIIFLWLLAMLQEFKDITIAFTWVLRFPSADQFGDAAVLRETNDDGDDKYTIQGITGSHRAMVGMVTLLRTFMTITLTVVGGSFLLKGTDYIGLLMDAVALVFIVEIAQIIYAQCLRPEIREQCESLEPMQVLMYGVDFLNRRPPIVDVIHLISLLIIVICVMMWYNSSTVQPLYDALECTCLSKGEKCREAESFSYDFWYQYWKSDVPAVFSAVDELKASVEPPEEEEEPEPSASPSAAPAPAMLLQAAGRVTSMLARQHQHGA